MYIGIWYWYTGRFKPSYFIVCACSRFKPIFYCVCLQVEMTGSSMFDYVHVQDHSELAEQLGLCLPHGATMPSPSSASDEGSSSAATTPRAVTPPIPDSGRRHYTFIYYLAPQESSFFLC